EEPPATQVSAAEIPTRRVTRKLSGSPLESLMLKSALTPTDYAEAWALTHYLAQRRGPEFVRYLKSMSKTPPLQPRTPAENLAEFRKFVSDAPARLDKKVSDYIHKLSQKKSYDTLYYYQVVFQQSLGNGVIRRAAMVSQSPQFIQQWILELTSPNGEIPNWEA